jgi:hypothetical protein
MGVAPTDGPDNPIAQIVTLSHAPNGKIVDLMSISRMSRVGYPQLNYSRATRRGGSRLATI